METILVRIVVAFVAGFVAGMIGIGVGRRLERKKGDISSQFLNRDGAKLVVSRDELKEIIECLTMMNSYDEDLAAFVNRLEPMTEMDQNAVEKRIQFRKELVDSLKLVKF